MEQEKGSSSDVSVISSKRICLRNDMEFMKESSLLDHLPMNITLHLSDGNIRANKMMLSIVSPVFKQMLYGSFKEASSDEVDLPKDSYKIMKLLFDLVFEGRCELQNLDDILLLMEVIDRYQINKVPVQRLCDKVILAELDSSNYVTMLEKFASVMSEASMKEVTDKVKCYCDNKIVRKFEEIKDLPVKVLLHLLQRNDIYSAEAELFDFLVKWHEYQTKECRNTPGLLPQLFNSIRYYLMSPRLLLTKVAVCSFVDKQVFMEALDCLYNDPLQLHESKGEKAPRLFSTLHWEVTDSHGNITDEDERGLRRVSFWGGHCGTIESSILQNGIYSFIISEPKYDSREILLLDISCNTAKLDVMACNVRVILFVYDEDIFLKIIEDHKTCRIYSTTVASSITLKVCAFYDERFSFSIMHAQVCG